MNQRLLTSSRLYTAFHTMEWNNKDNRNDRETCAGAVYGSGQRERRRTQTTAPYRQRPSLHPRPRRPLAFAAEVVRFGFAPDDFQAPHLVVFDASAASTPPWPLATARAARIAIRPGGETGRHKGLKIPRRRKPPCRFESSPGHHNANFSFRMRGEFDIR